MKKVALVVLLGLLAVLLTDCVVAYPTVPPPALRAEVILASPGPGFIWIRGYWGWRARGFYWVPGHWGRALRGRAWIDGRWEQRGRQWVWIKGHWR